MPHCADLAVVGGSFCDLPLRRDRHDAVITGTEPLQALEQQLGQRGGGDAPGAEQPSQLGNRRVGELVRHHSPRYTENTKSGSSPLARLTRYSRSRPCRRFSMLCVIVLRSSAVSRSPYRSRIPSARALARADGSGFGTWGPALGEALPKPTPQVLRRSLPLREAATTASRSPN